MINSIKSILLKKNNYDTSSIFYHSCKKIGKSNYIREKFIIELSKNKNVIHFGFLDVPFLKEKIESHSLLHLRIKNVANELFGIDVDQGFLDEYRKLTDDYSNAILNIQESFDDEVNLTGYDLILFPEVLEHVINPGSALRNLRLLSEQNNNATVCITVPNAFNLSGFIPAKDGIELVHPEHYFYFSPVTLEKLLKDTGFKNIEVYKYSHILGKITPRGITKNGVIALCSA